MAFEPYITFNEYVELGGTLPEDEFPIWERKAQRQLDYITFNRIPNLIELPTQVKEVLVEMIDRLFAKNKEGGGFSSAASYSNGVESITYREDASSKFTKELTDYAIQYLPEYLTARSVNFDVISYLQSKSNNP